LKPWFQMDIDQREIDMHRDYEQLVAEIIQANPGATARFVHDELQDRTAWRARTCPSESQVRFILRSLGCRSEGSPRHYFYGGDASFDS